MKKSQVRSQSIKKYLEGLLCGPVDQKVQTASIETHANDQARMCSDAYDGDGNTDPDDPHGYWINKEKNN